MSEDNAANTTEDEQQKDEPEFIRTLREKARRADELESQIAARDRELAFTKAGINPEDPKFKYFAKGYEGEMTADAIKAEAIEAGFLSDAEQAQKNTELAAHDQIEQATTTPPAPDGDFQRELDEAKTQADVLKVVAKYQPQSLVQD